MQSFSLPKPILSNLDKRYRISFWNNNPNSKTTNIISWDGICKTKDEGGLGFRRAEPHNMDLQMKLLWKLVKDHPSLWVDLVKKKIL